MERIEQIGTGLLALALLLVLLSGPGCIAGLSGGDAPATPATTSPDAPVIRGQIVPPGDAPQQP